MIYSSLDDLPSACGVLFDEAGKSSFFHTLQWYRNLVENGLPEGAKHRIYAMDGESGVEGMLPMMHDGKKRRLDSLANYYSSLFMPLVREAGNLGSLVDALAKDEMKWEKIDFHPMDVDSPFFSGLIDALKLSGMIVIPYFCFGNWYLEVGGRTYKEYFETLPSKLKNTLKRKSKQLLSSPETRIEIISEKGKLDEAIAAYQTVYNSSWKVPEPYPDFMPGLIRTCAEQGWLRLGLVHVDDEPVAAQVWMVKDGIASIYKLAYDERYSKLSAGSVLTSKLMEHVIDVDKVHEVDYLTGDDDYKKDWMSARRERWGLIAYNKRTFRGFFEGMLNLAWKRYKGIRNGRTAA